MHVLVGAQPHLQTNLLDFLGSLPAERLGTWACVGWDNALKDAASLDRYKDMQKDWLNTGSKELKAFVAARLQVPAGRVQ